MQLTYGLVGVLVSSLLLSACGGEDSADSIERNGEGGLFFGLYQADSTGTTPRNLGGVYLNVPSSNGLYFGQASFQFDPACQLVNALPILGDKIGSGLSGASGGKLDNPLIPSTSDDVAFSMPASYFFDGHSYGGNYTRLSVTAPQVRRTSECNTEYTLAPKGAWVSHRQGTRFPADFTIRQTSPNQVTWLPPAGMSTNRAFIMLLDANKLDKASDNAIVSQMTQATSSTRLNTYTLTSSSSVAKDYIVVVQLLNQDGKLVAYDDLSVRF